MPPSNNSYVHPHTGADDRELCENVRPPGWRNPTPRGSYDLLVIGGGTVGTQLRRLHKAIRVVLRAAVDHGGTSFAPYANEAWHHDTYLEHSRVFKRQGQPCAVCGTPIERIRVAGRGTNYCPDCQRR